MRPPDPDSGLGGLRNQARPGHSPFIVDASRNPYPLALALSAALWVPIAVAVLVAVGVWRP